MHTSPPPHTHTHTTHTRIVCGTLSTQRTAAQIKLLITHMIYTHWRRPLFTLQRRWQPQQQQPCDGLALGRRTHTSVKSKSINRMCTHYKVTPSAFASSECVRYCTMHNDHGPCPEFRVEQIKSFNWMRMVAVGTECGCSNFHQFFVFAEIGPLKPISTLPRSTSLTHITMQWSGGGWKRISPSIRLAISKPSNAYERPTCIYIKCEIAQIIKL